VVGAGPAGLTAGYLLAERGLHPLVLESDDQVGGLAKTIVRDGYRFDLGGHRFFTKSAEVERLWHETLGDELLVRPRLSRIYWNRRFLDYPLRAGDVVRKLGPIELTRALASYAAATTRPRGSEENLEEWISNRFGRRLFELFFSSYTRKVWGVPASELRAEWGAQRIRGLSFGAAARDAFRGRNGNGNGNGDLHSLLREFHYPRYGPGQMWEAMATATERAGGELRLGTPVERVHLEGGGVSAVTAGGETLAADHVISSMPLPRLVAAADPAPPAAVAAAARGLRYRDFLTVALVLRDRDPFPDNWIYVHDASVRVGRIQNFRSWSPWMVERDDRACVGLEYFCFEGDELWRMDDADLVDLATRELQRLGLAQPGAVERGWAVRVPGAYPVYDADYPARLATIRAWADSIAGLQQVGRNGLHRYNNTDHSMLTAIRAVENVCDGAGHDLWAVNTEAVYHEAPVPDEPPYRHAPETPATWEPAYLADE
jgi:protoporphyrinogen oxidase